MIIGVLQVSFDIPDSFSIKDKRSIMNSLKARLKNKFNVSVAETDQLDSKNIGMMGVVFASNEKRYVHQTLSKIASFLEREKKVIIRDIKTEVI